MLLPFDIAAHVLLILKGNLNDKLKWLVLSRLRTRLKEDIGVY